MNARFFLEQIRGQTQLEFDNIEVNSDAKAEIEIVFSNPGGDRVRVILPKDKVKEMISWKTLWSL